MWSVVIASTEARDRALYAEQLLVLLKDTWHSLTSVRAMTDTTEQALLLEHVVTMCIEEYYG